ncbi:MFS transporter, partial [bacterium]|nr:MFS transporter [bacterium]
IRNIGRAFSLPRMRLLFLVMLLLTLGFTLFTSYFQVYLIDRFHLSQSSIGDVFGYIGLWIAFAQGVVVRPIADRLRADQVLRFAPLGLAAALFLLLSPHTLPGLFFVLPLTAIFQGLVTPNITSLISASADAQSQGEILGINQSVVSLAQFLPGLFGGATAALYSGGPLLLAVGLTLAAWVTFVVGYRRAPSGQFHET